MPTPWAAIAEAGAVHEPHGVLDQAASALADELRRRVVELQFAGRASRGCRACPRCGGSACACRARRGRATGRGRRSPSSQRASTSEILPQPLVMKRLTPVRSRLPSSSWRGLEGHGLEVAAGVRLGQDHGAGALAAGEARQVRRLQLVGAEAVDRLGDVLEAEDVHEGRVGAGDHLAAHGQDGERDVEAAVRRGRVMPMRSAWRRRSRARRPGEGDLAVVEVEPSRSTSSAAKGDELAGDLPDDLEDAAVAVHGVGAVAWARGEHARLGEVVLAQLDDAREVQGVEMKQEVLVVGEEVGSCHLLRSCSCTL